MPRRGLLCLFAAIIIAWGQSRPLTVQQLVDFVTSQAKLIKQKKGTDQDLAKYLATVKLSEKLEDDVIEKLQTAGAGQLTVKALLKLQEQSKELKPAVLKEAIVEEPTPPPSSAEQARVLDEVRDYVANYDKNMTDFICMELEQRSIAPKRITRVDGEPSFRTVDSITSTITYYDHIEKKTATMHDSRPVSGNFKPLAGATSEGDFETMLKQLFDPETAAHFEWERWATLRTHLSMVFRFRVAKEHSSYSLEVPEQKQSIYTAYTGLLYVNADSPHQITKLVMKAVDLPRDFVIQRAETTLDYAYSEISGRRFLLPLNEELLMETDESFTRNSNSFRNYRKYEVGSEITFDIPKDAGPIPDSELKESAPKPPVDCKDPKNKDLPACKK